MNIVVCIKQVPDTETKIKVGADGRSIDLGDVNLILNPYDEFAIEAAITLKEQHGGEVTAVCLGNGDAAPVLRNALALGANKALLLKTDREDLDAASISAALADAIREQAFDVILMGKQAVDDDEAQVGPMVAEILSLPCLCQVVGIEASDEALTVKRQVEGGEELSTVPVPVVLTAQKGLNEPRYASLKDIMRAKRAPIDEQEITPPEPRVETVALSLPPERQAGLFMGQGVEAVPELINRLKEEAKVL